MCGNWCGGVLGSKPGKLHGERDRERLEEFVRGSSMALDPIGFGSRHFGSKRVLARWVGCSNPSLGTDDEANRRLVGPDLAQRGTLRRNAAP